MIKKFKQRGGNIFAKKLDIDDQLKYNMYEGGRNMVEKKFGEIIRELRNEKRMIQKEVAERVGIDVTYLSKIENRKLPPPSQEKIKRLAEVLDADEDRLITAANKVPEDIAEMIPNSSSKVPNLLREGKKLSDEEWEQVHQFIKKIKKGEN